jgi:hypothetical protein
MRNARVVLRSGETRYLPNEHVDTGAEDVAQPVEGDQGQSESPLQPGGATGGFCHDRIDSSSVMSVPPV